MKTMLRWVLLGLGAWIGLGAAEPRAREWTVDGVVRQALVYAPTKASGGAVPVIFVFHGHGGTMGHAARTFSYQTLWPEAVAVYMQGLPTVGALTDPEGKKPGWQKAPGDYADRDLKFFDAVFATVRKEFAVDAKRVFVTGHSNGGGFTYLLWAERGDVLAAVAPSAAVPGIAWAKKLKPKPALQVAGAKDELVKFAWQERAMMTVRRLNGCAATGEAWAKAGSITGTRYASTSGTPFVSLIYPGTHTYPAEASALIVKFFQEQTGAK